TRRRRLMAEAPIDLLTFRLEHAGRNFMDRKVKEAQKIRLAAYVLGLAGVALFTFLLIQSGASDVVRALAAVGPWLLVIAAFHLLPMLLDGLSWWILFPLGERARYRTVFFMRWLGESVSNLLPVAQVGGDLVRARLAVLNGTRMSVSAATVLVDITVSVFTQTVFTTLGLGLLILATGRTNLMGPALAGAPLAIAAVAGFYIVQRLGLFRLFTAIVSRWATNPEWRSMAGKGGEVDEVLRETYAKRHVILACCLSSITSWLIGSVEVWIGLYALGIPSSFDRAVILESVGQGVRSALFFIPGAIGVHEGGYLFVGGLLGIPGDAAFALALIRRVRELALGIPGLIVWQLIEGGRAWRKHVLPVVRQSEKEAANEPQTKSP
ncbi:MAG TPA: flippase-like domain-containing protein, partial [Chthoniobacterales bacterium]|nr:flippase-like domain-containing protein [Chthoniobacterales bacterium]